MAVKCVTYGGKIGWFLRKHFSKYTSEAYLNVQYQLRKKNYRRYIREFDKYIKMGICIQPCLISIETINRCNGKCDFCPASVGHEKRPFSKMSESLFKKIIDDLQKWDYRGYLNLYVNNEPFMDARIIKWYQYAKEKLPYAKMLLYTNGSLLNIEKLKAIAPYIEKMIINNYTETCKLDKNLYELFCFALCDENIRKKDITFQIRFIHEILTNRAGTAPNKIEKRKHKKRCIMPYTDLVIYPDGTVGLCCNDALEKTCYGNVNNEDIKDIWMSNEFSHLRRVIGENRSEYPFCRNCDFIDAGIRDGFIKKTMKDFRYGRIG